MDISESKIRSTYDGMETEELLTLKARGGLTEVGQKVIDEVLSGRGVKAEFSEKVIETVKAEAKKEDAFYDELATRKSRLIAKSIDFILLMIVMSPFYVAGRLLESNYESIGMAVGGVFLWFSDAFGGQSPGKRIMLLKAVDYSSNAPCTPINSLLRNVTLGAGIFDFVWSLGKSKQRLGDFIANTKVIKVSAGAKSA